MKPRPFLTTLALALVCAACSDGVGPQAELTLRGEVGGLRTDDPRADVVAAAHADDDCTGGPVVARAATKTAADGTYRLTLAVPRSGTVCLAVEVSAQIDGSTVTRRIEERTVTLVEGGRVITLAPITIRLVITRPNP